jgi:hypothetical protein
MTRKQTIKFLRQQELRDFRTYVEDRMLPYTRYVVDQDMLARIRAGEYAAEVKAAPDAFTAYWAGSITASVARDVRAGRVVTINAK